MALKIENSGQDETKQDKTRQDNATKNTIPSTEDWVRIQNLALLGWCFLAGTWQQALAWVNSPP